MNKVYLREIAFLRVEDVEQFLNYLYNPKTQLNKIREYLDILAEAQIQEQRQKGVPEKDIKVTVRYPNVSSKSYTFYYCLFEILWETACKISELNNLRVENIDLDKKQIKIYKRIYKISDKLCEKLNILFYRLNLKPNDLIVNRYWGANSERIERKEVSVQALSKYMKRHFKYCWYFDREIDPKYLTQRAHPYVLRHTKAVQLISAGMTREELTKFLGLSDIRLVECYYKYAATQINITMEDIEIQDNISNSRSSVNIIGNNQVTNYGISGLEF